MQPHKDKLTFSDIDPVSLFGHHDEHVHYLEKKFGISLVSRNDSIFLTGPAEQTEKANKLLKHIIERLQREPDLPYTEIGEIIRQAPLPPDSTSHGSGEPTTEIGARTYKGLIRPRTKGQEEYISSIENNDIVFGIGPAGTGKTYLAVAMAVAALKSKKISRILLARPAVEAGEKLGFLPGSFEDKVDPYLRPLYDALQDLVEPDRLGRLQTMKVIEVVPLAYMRGRTLNDAFIILDEAQNTTPQQMKMFLTRLGTYSKAVVTGDVTQTDLGVNQVSGLTEAPKILTQISGLSFVHLTEQDVVRNPLVQKIIKAYEAHTNVSQEQTTEHSQ
tara:strand:+ start:8135 stop:9127 length:993 start_codon:yes stop_codon:yes gene_type:complete